MERQTQVEPQAQAERQSPADRQTQTERQTQLDRQVPADRQARLERALSTGDASARLRAALQAGTAPEPGDAEVLVRRCETEPDFFVRDMLTWALTRNAAEAVVPLLLAELDSPVAQARSQALHTLSKIRDASAWPALRESHLTDPDDEVARAAWRAAVVLAPEEDRSALARVLAGQFGRGELEVQRSLSRALVDLGEASVAAVEDVIARTEAPGSTSDVGLAQDAGLGQNAAQAHGEEQAHRADRVHGAERVHAHALATEALRRDPDMGFAEALEEAKRVSVMGVDAEGGAAVD
ncbi:HEAT repeat domain-containing protein [Brevibacterium sp.]|uniref:HEAT repeat domain-containing protein n=1 Tax=Brevibacterium sp. TaxID=1701 RepID=UPI0025C04BA2|nr:HEAT repeat domain-containing protein [Brevibacterium sp.]